MTLGRILLSICVIGGATLFTRALPFLFFSRRRPPEIVRFIEQYIPPMVMVILVIYSFRLVDWLQVPHGIPETLGAVLTAILHLWKGNALLSIFGGTLFYMAAVQTGFLDSLFFS